MRIETGEIMEENARIMGMANFESSGIPTFSLDAALRIESLPAEQ